MDIQSLLNGTVFLINKPIFWTSFDIIKKLKFIIKDKIRENSIDNIEKSSIKKLKIGHAGTLDPFASGLLIIATGKKTKEINCFQNLDKTYEGQITIGYTTPSYDSETSLINKKSYDHITNKNIEDTKQLFIGEINQKPPIYSAIKIEGERLYHQARKGIDVDIPSRQIIIKEFEIAEIDLPKIKFRVTCSKGTYIRSLAHDFGRELGVGGYLSELIRIKIGTYNIKDAYDIEKIKDFII
ncbi:MAG: tRNA pseudouridine(55) synthase TruB [Bacteroidetes bacterium]|nr:tRNA pseudouridine(55) synthase TruB [Bacteroidota bacterium]